MVLLSEALAACRVRDCAYVRVSHIHAAGDNKRAGAWTLQSWRANQRLLHPQQSGGLSFGAGGDDVERVKGATDIVRLIGEQIRLKPKGREYAGLCPFHNDSSPSMLVSPNKQLYKCFACGAGGDALTFVIKYHKMEFREALEFLAERAGMTLTKRQRQGYSGQSGGDGESQATSRTDLLAASGHAQEFFRAILAHEQHGAAARAIVQRRGITQEMQAAFGIGASPDRWDGLLITLQKNNVALAPFVEVGLLKTRDSGGNYDGFRNRVMFPICDPLGRVIAFGARKINEEDEPKYLNSSESRLFKKASTLYAMHLASRAMQTSKTALICEGYTDVIACHQAGFNNAVATLGTALTKEHAPVLRRLCERVVLLFDGDQAGQRAADRAAEVFFAEPLDVRIVSLEKFTDAKDPDELLKREGGREVFARAIAGSTELLDHRFQRVSARLGGASEAAVARTITGEVERLVELGLAHTEPLRQTLIIKRLAQLVGVDERVIRSVIPAGRSGPRRNASTDYQGDGAPSGSTQATGTAEHQRDEGHAGFDRDADDLSAPLHTASLLTIEHVLGCMLCDGSLWAGLTENDKDALSPRLFRWEVLRRVAQIAHDVGEDGGMPGINAVIARAREAGEESENVERICEAAVQLMSRVYESTEGKPERLQQHFAECLKRARNDALLRVEVKPRQSSARIASDSERSITEGEGSTTSSPSSHPATQKAQHAEQAQGLADRLALLRKAGPDLRRVPKPGG